ncbi:hypothetical protein BDI4_830072 [Burkholderia diffusa]|nr:hypothetical protein BDI4_830072 [Burkholderia diffusa]
MQNFEEHVGVILSQLFAAERNLNAIDARDVSLLHPTARRIRLVDVEECRPRQSVRHPANIRRPQRNLCGH